MNRPGALAIALLAATAAWPRLADQPLTVRQVEDQAAADAKTPEGKAYLKEFFTNPWSVALDTAFERCRATAERSGTLTRFDIALVIGDSGYPTDALVSPDNDGLTCVAGQLKTMSFIKPPHEGFAIYMPFKRTEPGDEAMEAGSGAGEPSHP